MIYSNEETEFNVQFVNNKHLFIEIKENCEYVDSHYKSLGDMISEFKKYEIPIVGDNYFMNKASVIFKDEFGKN